MSTARPSRALVTLVVLTLVALSLLVGTTSPARAEPAPAPCSSLSTCDSGSIGCYAPRFAVVRVQSNGWTNVTINGVKKAPYLASSSVRYFATGSRSAYFVATADYVNKTGTYVTCEM